MAELSLTSPLPREAARARWLGLALVATATLAGLYGVWVLYLIGQPLLAALIFAAVAGFALVFSQRRLYSARFIYPGIVAILIFVAFPVIYTVYIGFTNYSSPNLLTFQRAQDVLLSRMVIDADTERPFQLVRQGDAYRIYLPEGESGLLSDPFVLDGTAVAVMATAVDAAPDDPLPMRDVVALRNPLGQVVVETATGAELRLSGLRSFAFVEPELRLQEDGTLVSTIDGSVLTPDHATGYFRNAEGVAVPPGFRVNIGTANFERIFNSPGIRAPMLGIFVWTVTFAALSVALTFALGLALAVVLQWPHLRFKPLYRILLILPYAVPGFISILIFRGMFNQNFGEINLILNAVFGLSPAWNTDSFLARTMMVIVNVWLGYPYMMLLAMGFLQSVPEDHKRAAALEGASGLRVFFTITLPQILPPFLPLLIASFAFNFNNIVLVLLLTRGLPDMAGTVVPAGHTDILGSFTYRISFLDSGQNFGLAGAISLLIFVIVTVIAYANFVALRRATSRGAAS